MTQSPYRLILKEIEISDEELYICDTTYFMPKDTCEITRGYRIDLKVLGKLETVFSVFRFYFTLFFFHSFFCSCFAKLFLTNNYYF